MTTDSREQITRKVTYMGIAVNVVLSVAQIVAGILAHSQALVADGLHTLSDLITDFIVLITTYLSAKAADPDHPYGHARIETLSSIFLGVALIGVAIGIGYRGVLAISEGSYQDTQGYALLFAFMAIFSKEFLYRYTLKAARKIKSTLLESNALHHRSDVFSSIVVVIGISGQLSGIEYMDSLAAMIVAIMISMMGIHLIKKAFQELIDTSLDRELIDDIKAHILKMDGVFDIHSLRSRSMGGMGYIDTEILVNPRLSVSEAHYISLSIEQMVKKQFDEIIDITVHIDPVAEIDHDLILQLPSRAKLLFNLYSSWESIEDSDKIKNIRLHYLTQQIEVDIILPLELGCENGHPLEHALHENTKSIPFVGKVNIYYAP